MRVSLATVYNALHHVHPDGLLHEVALDNGRTDFDANISEHHFFVEGEGGLIDVVVDIGGDRLPIPEGMKITVGGVLDSPAAAETLIATCSTAYDVCSSTRPRLSRAPRWNLRRAYSG